MCFASVVWFMLRNYFWKILGAYSAIKSSNFGTMSNWRLANMVIFIEKYDPYVCRIPGDETIEMLENVIHDALVGERDVVPFINFRKKVDEELMMIKMLLCSELAYLVEINTINHVVCPSWCEWSKGPWCILLCSSGFCLQ